jgi:flagellar protein FlaG
MVRLVDMQTNEVIKEIPPANMLDVIGKIWDDMGIAVDRKG